MLVLSRKLGEKIYIGDNICVTVVDIDRGKIRLGISAPRDVPVYREELLPIRPVAGNDTPPTTEVASCPPRRCTARPTWTKPTPIGRQRAAPAPSRPWSAVPSR